MAQEQFDLTRAFELKGKWWLPENLGHRVTGTLKFNPTVELKLELDGCLDPKRQPGTNIMFSPPVVHGLCKGGKSCSLLKTFETNISGSSEIPYSALEVNLAIVGTLTPPLENTVFHSLAVQYTNLEEWVARQVFSTENRIFYDVAESMIEVLAIIAKSKAAKWLEEMGEKK